MIFFRCDLLGMKCRCFCEHGCRLSQISKSCDAEQNAKNGFYVLVLARRTDVVAKKADKMVPLTVRFTGAAIDAIKDIAAEHGFSAAEIIRFTMDNKLKEYLGSIQFMDYEQGKDIERCVIELTKMTQKVGQELNRIGVNYNQEIKLRQIEKEYDSKRMTVNERMQWNQRRNEILAGQSVLSKEEMDELMTRYETVATKVGELLKLLNS